MIVLDLSILNQKGTPMFNSDTLANRPSAGIVGRIFIAIDSPFGIYRDTGTSWDQISSVGVAATTIYNGDGTLTGNRTISSGGFNLSFTPQTTFSSSLTAATGASSYAVLGSNTLSYAVGFSSSNIGNVYGANGAINLQNFLGNATFAQANLASAMVSVNSIDFGSGGHTITMTQSTGIRAMTGHQSQIQFQGSHNGTISHAAISQNLGFYRAVGSTRTLTITNAYSLLLNNLDDYGGGFTFTNRWGIYQAGASDINYFAARVGIGITAPTESLHVIGAGLFNSGAANFPLQGVSTSSISLVRLTNSSGSVSFGRDGTFASIEVNATGRLFISSVGNTLLGASTDNGNRLQVYGSAFVGGNLTLNNSGSTQLVFATAGTFLHDAVGTNTQLIYTANDNYRIKFAGGGFGTIIGASANSQTTNNTLLINNRVNRNNNIFQINSTPEFSTTNVNVSTIALVGVVAFDALNNQVGSIQTGVKVEETFSPNTANKDIRYIGLSVQPIINQTGGAVQTTRGLYINPTLTSSADWRAIEISAGVSILAPATTASATLRVPSGTAPTSPVDGDIWFNGTNLFMRIGGVTRTFTII